MMYVRFVRDVLFTGVLLSLGPLYVYHLFCDVCFAGLRSLQGPFYV